jgi:hypothetical protein
MRKLNPNDYPITIWAYGRWIGSEDVEIDGRTMTWKDKQQQLKSINVSRRQAAILLYKEGAKFYRESRAPPHHFTGSYLRHTTIERLLIRLQETGSEYFYGGSLILRRLFKTLFDFALGLNCSFPLQDIIKFTRSHN